MLVQDMIRLNALSRGDSEALVVGVDRYTYADLQARIEQVAAGLRGNGVARGDRVAVLAKNTLEYFLLYFATASVGAIMVPLNFWHRKGEHEYTIANCEPVLLFVEDELRPSLGELPAGTTVLTMPVGSDDRADWTQFLDKGAGQSGAVGTDVLETDPHMILYTSGTTGRPKGAVLSHRRTCDDAMAMAAALGTKPTDTFANYFPPFHVGNWDHMKLFLLVGARVIFMRQFDAGKVIATIERERLTVVLGVPTMLHELLNHPDLARADVSSIRLIYYGAYDPSGIMQRTAEFFGAREGRVEMAHTFGLTEGGPFILLCQPPDIFNHWGSVGKAIPGIEATLLDDAGRPVPPGEPGELCFRGPRMTGYWKAEEATDAALAGGWLHTGDIANTDKDGFYYIVDRKKDMIRSGGQNVYSKEVEDCLQSHPLVAEAAVIGLPDPVYEEQVCAVIVRRPSEESDDDLAVDITSYVRTNLAGYNAPRSVQFVDELPRNAVGKIQKHLLRREFGTVFEVAAR